MIDLLAFYRSRFRSISVAECCWLAALAIAVAALLTWSRNPATLSTVLAILALAGWGLVHRKAGIAAAPEIDRQTPAAVEDAENAGLRRAVAAAEAANAAKTRYLVGVSHEIRSPLNAIYGYAQLLERAGAIAPVEAGGAIRRSAEHLTNLVEGILEISRIESGVFKLRSDVVHLPGLLDHVLGMFRMGAEAKGLALRYEPFGRLPGHVRTDEKRLRQILINLLSNAVKYTQAGSVTLAISYRNQVATIDISDTGIGIPSEDLERIFEPFERGSAPDALLQPGIGLGLAITRVLAQILGGDIEASSTPGQGSRFRLRMFLSEQLASDPAAASNKRILGYAGDRRTVLVIDDDASQTFVLDTMLRPLGFAVFCADSGGQGLALAERCRPDIVLLDIEMPGMSGWEVARRLRESHGKALPIVMISANVQEIGEDTADHDRFIAKPVELDALLAEIGRHLRLAWHFAGDAPLAPAAEPVPSAPVPGGNAPEAQGWAERIRKLARVGHIRAVESALDELESEMPAGATTISAMREHVRNFDLRSLVKMLDGQRRH